ncbi:MAG TPA: FkbM family methyltransferase [Solirubrobacteraceae bacterium]|nr:FkbM family methyltransferase [Solirubrobacteraceae bacterium]
MSAKTNREIKRDVDRLLPNVRLERIFDVGGNVGQTAQALSKYHPEAELWCFEPVAASFEQLTRATEAVRARAFNVALGAQNGSGLVTARGTSTNNRIVGPDGTPATTEEIRIVTGDAFCAEHGVDRIDYLKVDTEGHELEVLRGFHRMLSRYAIDLIELEAGMNWDNTKHVPIERLKGFLEPMGYLIFRVYEQVAERHGRPHLRRCNLLFLSRPIVEGNLRETGRRAAGAAAGPPPHAAP